MIVIPAVVMTCNRYLYALPVRQWIYRRSAVLPPRVTFILELTTVVRLPRSRSILGHYEIWLITRDSH